MVSYTAIETVRVIELEKVGHRYKFVAAHLKRDVGESPSNGRRIEHLEWFDELLPLLSPHRVLRVDRSALSEQIGHSHSSFAVSSHVDELVVEARLFFGGPHLRDEKRGRRLGLHTKVT